MRIAHCALCIVHCTSQLGQCGGVPLIGSRNLWNPLEGNSWISKQWLLMNPFNQEQPALPVKAERKTPPLGSLPYVCTREKF